MIGTGKELHDKIMHNFKHLDLTKGDTVVYNGGGNYNIEAGQAFIVYSVIPEEQREIKNDGKVDREDFTALVLIETAKKEVLDTVDKKLSALATLLEEKYKAQEPKEITMDSIYKDGEYQVVEVSFDSRYFIKQ